MCKMEHSLTEEASASQVLVAVPVVFHVVRVALGYSMADAIESGWLLSSEVCGAAPHQTVYPASTPNLRSLYVVV